MREKILLALLAVSLMCGSTGCGKAKNAEGEAAGGDSIDLSGLSGGFSAMSGGSSSANRTLVEEDSVSVKVPTISYDDFGNGFYDTYVLSLGNQPTDDLGDEGYEVKVGSGTHQFKGRKEGNSLAGRYLGGGIGGNLTISNDPGWSSDMSVSHEEIICQIETEQDSDGNITLVHRYNKYASYDDVFTYDNAGRMLRRDHYEYPKGQAREAVGALWYMEYSYDSAGRLTRRQETSNQDNGVNEGTEYYYDNMGRITTQINTSHYFGSDFYTIQQTYDSVTKNYEYDDTGRVSSVMITVDWAQTLLQPDPVSPTTVFYFPES